MTVAAPLFPKGTLGEFERHPNDIRDIQVWPRHIRETDHHQELHRTAGVKHPLRAVPERHEVLTTYEHDFGIMSRPKPPQGGDGNGELISHAGKTRRWNSLPPAKLMGFASKGAEAASMGVRFGQDDDMQSTRSRSSSRPATGMSAITETGRRTLGMSTMEKLQATRGVGDPLRVSVRGWDMSTWTPKTHPSMILGMTDKRVHLMQATAACSSRSKDIPFTTR
eukprot:CAMPEP_0178437442 /NCGR_PEP_ID=MMETSP0689_2-20121128/34999_1 /TAXON_ID=160604 /ORGANISM="Amphidinium massartii, Strain CS-259" /LENGTH=222 /DNA_ID=CAMNT_0020059653 /DNA_START=100 /DNA_END=768 /DNA_ORIENTATION=+